jgi:LCP family protein required for cell wall assembly
MILLSVEMETGRAALIGIPRNVRFAPMPPPLDATFPDGYPDLLNALWVWVEEHPGSFPGDPAIAPFDAVQETIGLLTGLDVDAMAVAELNGFVQAVDALGGLDVTIPSPVYDARYPTPDGTGYVEFYLPAGPQHLDGWHALAYARTRHQDSDYQRMQRQQTVLVALQRQLRCGLAFRITELLGIARDTLWTNLPLDGLSRLVDVMGRVDADAVTRLTLAPPAFSPNLDATTIDRMRAAIQAALAGAIASPTPSPSASGDPGGCD